jgi:rubredoxin
MTRAYTCTLCRAIYDPTSQGHCPGCRRHPHLENDCDHDCDTCGSVLFPPKDGYLDVFQPIGATLWQRRMRAR